MAFSSQVTRAQAIKLCELCQEGSIKWRCIDCVQCMCEKCKIIHLRGAVTAKHQILTIATPLQEMQKKIVMENIPCKDHKTRMTCMFCQTCDLLVCSECVSTNHSKHQFLPLETGLAGRLDELQSVKTNIIDNLKYCRSKIDEIQNIKSNYRSIFEESVEKIQQKERELKDAITRYAKTLQQKVEKERLKTWDAVSTAERHINLVRKELENHRDEIENALKATHGAVIFETKISIQTLDKTFDSYPKEVKQFVSVTDQKTNIQDLFGTLQKTEVAISKEQISLKVLRTFTTDLPYIDNLLAKTETSAWIGVSDNELIQKIDIEGDKITKLKEISIDLVDMDLTPNNDILFSDYQSSDVKLLTQSGEIKLFLSVKPLLPKGIHVTKDNKIMVGVREEGDPAKVTIISQRAVLVFDMNGKQKHAFQYDKNGQRLFTVPYRIITNINQDILVIDRTSGDTGRVVCLDREGMLKFIYEGYPKINSATEFDPRDLAITSVGHIIVSDYSYHALHVLSDKGDLLFCKVTKDLGISYPWTVNIDRKGQIWVGCGTGGKQTGAKIHIVKLLL